MIKYDKLVTVCRLWDACSWTIHSHTQQRSWSWALLRILFSTCLFQRKWKVKDLSSAVVSVTDSDPATVRSTVLGPTQQHADPGPFTQNFILTKSREPFIQADIWATRTAWPKSMRRRLAVRPLRVLRLVKGRGGRKIEFQCQTPSISSSLRFKATWMPLFAAPKGAVGMEIRTFSKEMSRWPHKNQTHSNNISSTMSGRLCRRAVR